MVETTSQSTPAELQGTTVQVLTELITFKVTSAQTGGAYTVVETITAPGGGVPPHIQHQDTEAFFVLEGTYTFMLEGSTIEAGPGTHLFVPAEAVHSFQNNGSDPARMMIINAPGGIHERFFQDVGTPVEDPANPPTPDMDAQVARVLEIAPTYGIEMLPPQED